MWSKLLVLFFSLFVVFVARRMPGKQCIFCTIAKAEDANTVIEFESEDIVIFKDIHPASDFHYLAIPKRHIKNVKSISVEHVPLLEEMRGQLKAVIQRKSPGLAETELSLGFHWPPFNSVGHLHMHAIAPVSKMGFLQRQMFKKDSFWYREADVVIESLRTSGQGNK